ncbi:MAG: penicillin-binding transpeptidase domain-containing protein [Microgenomates group bacterium]
MKRIFNNKLSPVQKIALGDIQFRGIQDPGRKTVFMIFTLGIVIVFIILFIRLFNLTIVKGEYYKRLSESNRIKEILIEPLYGTIRDRKGFVLAENKESNVSNAQDFIRSKRTYYYPEETAHLIGYRQIADTYDLQHDYCMRKLIVGERVGKKGIEQLHDCSLRGVPGKKLIEVNASGKAEGVIAVIPPTSGKDVQLAIDIELQKTAYKALQGRRGVVIVMQPKTGELLAFVSSPSFDPTLFEIGDNKVKNIINNEEKPLLNRITEGVYQPGSIFKPILAVGALEDDIVTKDYLIQDNGFVMAGALRFGNWYFLQYGKTEGPVNMIKAISRSNDTYFYKLGEKMGPEKIQQWAEKFGLGNTVNIGFPQGEGTLPSPFWKKEILKENWYLGDTYNYSIGQGYLLTTPLQMAYALNAFPSNGYVCIPKFLKGESADCKKLPLSQENIQTIQEGMRQACSTGGTGWPLFDFKIRVGPNKPTPTSDSAKKTSSESAQIDTAKYQGIQVACKTGTAESHAKSGIPHAWIYAYAPFENPEIAITILVEEGGQGSDIAAPIARDILKAYFERAE